MRTVEQLLISPPSSFNRAEWGLLYLEGKVNGYWPKNSIVLRWLLKRLAPAFRESNANSHDLNYLIGGTEKDRLRSDRGFGKRLARDSFNTGYKLPYYLFLMLAFYIAVRIMGRKHFNYKYK